MANIDLVSSNKNHVNQYVVIKGCKRKREATSEVGKFSDACVSAKFSDSIQFDLVQHD